MVSLRWLSVMQLLIASSIAVSTSGRRAFKSTVEVTAALVTPIAALFTPTPTLPPPRAKKPHSDAPLSAAREDKPTRDGAGSRTFPAHELDCANNEPGSPTQRSETLLTLIIAPATISVTSLLPPSLPEPRTSNSNPRAAKSTNAQTTQAHIHHETSQPRKPPTFQFMDTLNCPVIPPTDSSSSETPTL
jgi:hypothetical protein